LNLGLLDGQDAYLLQNEVVVLNGERTREDGHTPSVRDLRHQLFHRETCSRLMYIVTLVFSLLDYERIIVVTEG
jgi:hypothetical protein